MKKGAIGDELAAASHAVAMLGGSLRETRQVALPGLDDARCLVILDKLSPTPGSYPRRPASPPSDRSSFPRHGAGKSLDRVLFSTRILRSLAIQ